MARDTATLVREAADAGFTVKRTRGGHVRLVPPGGGETIVAPSTPSDHRSLKNTRAVLKRAGLGQARVDERREQRVSRGRRHTQTTSTSAVVLDLLSSTPVALSAKDIAERSELDERQAAQALNYLNRTHECVHRESRGRYAYASPGDRRELEEVNAVAPVVVDAPSLATQPPSLFETIATDENRNLVVRDEDGRMWLAVPLWALVPEDTA